MVVDERSGSGVGRAKALVPSASRLRSISKLENPITMAVAGVIAHADRGSQYTSNDYLEFCQTHQLRPSVGRTGVCWDNAVAESFWQSLKREAIQHRVFATRAEARRAVFRWINWYNTTRLHSSLDYVPPIEWEQQYRQAS